MNLNKFIQELETESIHLWVEGERLRYRAPKDALTPALLQEIKTYRDEIIAYLQKPVQMPLSYGQRALWFFYQLSPESAAYIIALCFRLEKSSDISALRQAVSQIIQRHPIMRTTYHVEMGEPVAHIHPELSPHFEVIDATQWSQEQVDRWLVQEAERPFDLEQGPMIRFTVLERETEFLFVEAAHHITMDFFSMQLLNHDLGRFYEANQTGTPLNLPKPERTYGDFVSWEAEVVQEKGETLWAYWQQQLAGELPALELPADHPRPLVQSYRGVDYISHIDASLTQEIHKVARETNNTLFTTLFAAFQAFLHRYTGQRDLIVGTPTSGRQLGRSEAVVGYFVNPIVLRTTFDGDPVFIDLLNQIRQTVWDGLSHKDYPFALLVEKLQPKRDLSRAPIYQVEFGLERATAKGPATAQSQALFGEMMQAGQQGADIDLTVNVIETETGLRCHWAYSSDLFEAETIERMAQHFEILLQGIVENPNAHLSELSLLTDTEQHQQLVEWNSKIIDIPTDRFVHQLFEDQAARTPDAIAVVRPPDRQIGWSENGHVVDADRATLTYRELNERANQLAHYLRQQGVGSPNNGQIGETLVAVCGDHSLETIISIWGVLKAGGVYVPLEPTYPPERLAAIIEDAQPHLLLTRERWLSKLPDTVPAICLDRNWDEIAQLSNENPISYTQASDLAYLIYTSGTTGKPKGVMIEHGALQDHVYAIHNELDLKPTDRVMIFSSFCFDATIEEVIPTLIYGGRIVFRPGGRALSIEEFTQLIEQEGVTIVNLIASYWQEWVSKLADCPPPSSLRIITSGGESAAQELLHSWRNQVSDELTWRGIYGPTETTITMMFYNPTKHVGAGKTIPLGQTFANTPLYVLDEYHNPVPIGVPGELYIGGTRVARGYKDDPELTAKRFIKNPFTSENGAGRLYKTGDLVRYLPTSKGGSPNMEFLGRIDTQVKIRGFRIELDEIDAVLTEHPSVREAAVIVHEMENTVGIDKRLVAYVVLNRIESESEMSLKAHIQSHLPSYMVPSAFVLREEPLPRLASNKINRRALPIEDISFERTSDLILPRTETEEKMAGIWADVLKLEQVGIDDNFFELGGHSLLATQVITQIRQTFEVELSLRTLFQEATVAALSDAVEAVRKTERLNQMPPIVPVERTSKRLPLSFAQQRMWFLDQLEGQNATYNMPISIQVTGHLDTAALKQGLQTIVERHESLRTCFVEEEGKPYQMIQAVDLLLPITDLTMLPPNTLETKVEQLAQAEVTRPFDLTQAPLMRAKLLRLDGETHILLVTMHHIISDGLSVNNFMAELLTLYQNSVQDAGLPLPHLPIQYVDFAHWQRAWLQGEVLERQLGYWQTQLANAPELLQLPTDRPRLPVQTTQGRAVSFAIDATLVQALQALSQRSGTTLFTTMLVAYHMLLARYSGQTDVVVAVPIGNRNYKEIEPLIGLFINTLAIRLDLSGTPSFNELLRQAHRVVQEAYEHQDFPFERLVDELQLTRSLGYNPLVQAGIVLQDQQDESVEVAGLQFTPLEFDVQTVRLDLEGYLWESAGEIQGRFVYNTDLFDHSTIERMVAHYQMLLAGIVEQPHQSIYALPLLTEQESRQLLLGWNATQTVYPQDKLIHQWVETQAVQRPDAIAVKAKDKIEAEEKVAVEETRTCTSSSTLASISTLSYHQINERANQLAHYLQSLGVGSGSLVGICMPRSLEMVIGLLGVLKAGGAYVPLDPNYPEARLAFMVEDAVLSVLLTLEDLRYDLPEPDGHLCCLDSDWGEIADYSTANLDCAISQEDIAYVIYTSGSTGNPKGVLVSHQALLNLVFWHKRAFQITPTDQATQLASLAFDAAVWEIWPYLATGSTLHLVEPELLINPEALRDWMIAQEITISFAPTPLAEQLLHLSWPNEITLRTLLTGGDKLHQPPRTQLPFQLINNYGPTENAVVATSGLISPDEEGVPSIGRPIDNVQVYILDTHQQPVPIGIPGELCIGGDSLANGYHNRPGLTAEQFIEVTFGDETRRLYRTGDLVRYRSDGTIEFLGRIDTQVKIRGYRVELGEIETALLTHAKVEEAAVIARENQPGSKRLVAYVVFNDSDVNAPSHTLLRDFLKLKLPDYMIPAHFVFLDTLPLTPNGKVDHRALPAPEITDVPSEISEADEISTVEQALVDIWRDVLGLPQIDVHDNFFAIGGDSILSVQIVSRAREIGIQFFPRLLFQHQTVAKLAEVVDADAFTQGQSQQHDSEKNDITDETMPLTPIQHWFFEQEQSEPHHFNQSLLLEVSALVNPSWLEQAVQSIINHHDGLRLRFMQELGEWQQRYSPQIDDFILSVIDLSTYPAQEQRTQLETEAARLQATLDLTDGPLCRMVLFQMGEEQPHRLLIIIHHLAVDGISWRILLEDLENAYQQIANQQSVQLPPKTTSFQAWSTWLSNEGVDVVADDIDYWAEIEIDEGPALPTDLSIDPETNTIAHSGEVRVTLSAAETQALLREAPNAYQTQINDLLLTALLQAFESWTGEKSLVLDLEGHGRETGLDETERLDLSRTVGWFTSIFPVELTLDKLEIGDQIKSVKEQLRRIPNQGVSYGILRYLAEEPSLLIQETPQVSFNYLGQMGNQESGTTSLILGIANESTGTDFSPARKRPHLLDINCVIVDGQLQIDWIYGQQVHHRETIEMLAARYVDALRLLIEHCQSPTAHGYTVSDFSAIDLTQAELDNLLARLSSQEQRNGHHPQNVPALENQIEDIYELAPMQQGLLFETLYAQTAETADLYAMQYCLVLNEIDVDAWKAAWSAVIERHPILRTLFVWQGQERPLQIVRPEVVLPWSEQDWRGRTQLQADVEQFLQQDRERGLDLEQAPLMRFTLLQVDTQRHYFVWTFHHILLDGWCMPILMQEVLRFYEAFTRGETLKLPLPSRYQDYISWLQQRDLAQDTTFWRSRLAGMTEPTVIGRENSHQPTNGVLSKSSGYAHEVLTLSTEIYQGLERLTRAHQLTMSTIFQGAWAVLLSRYSRQDQVLFGVTVSGRPPTLAGVESMLGLFINVLPAHIELAPNAQLIPWLQQVQEEQLTREQHAYNSLADIQSWSEIPRHHRLFESSLTYENYPIDRKALAEQGQFIQEVRVHERTTTPLTLLIMPEDGRLTIQFNYKTDNFDGATITKIAQRLQRLLSQIIEQPDIRLEQLDLRSDEEQKAEKEEVAARQQVRRGKLRASRRKVVAGS